MGPHVFRVRMGQLTTRVNDLLPYLTAGLLDLRETTATKNIPLDDNIFPKLRQKGIESWNMGLTGDRDPQETINGEPHVVFFIPKQVTLPKLRQIAVELGPTVTKNRNLFPQEINSNFVVVLGQDAAAKKVKVIACTHERGLGEDADHSVTDACGTGATVIGALLFNEFHLDDSWRIEVTMPGGTLTVEQICDSYYLTGTAERIDHGKKL